MFKSTVSSTTTLYLLVFIYFLNSSNNYGVQCLDIDQEDDRWDVYTNLQRPYKLSEKFEYLRKSQFVKNLTAQRDLERTEKVRQLSIWLISYQLPDRFDLLNMFERMIIIQNKMSKMMNTNPTRTIILQSELKMGVNLDEKYGRSAKLKYLADNTDWQEETNLCLYTYFFADIDWEDTYSSNVFLPAKQVFLNYYFRDNTMTILNDKKLDDDEKIDKIFKFWVGIDYFSTNEKDSMEKMYRQYLADREKAQMDSSMNDFQIDFSYDSF